LPTLLIILAGMFLLLQLAPGDTVDALIAQMGGGGDAKLAEELRRFYGLDLSIPAQLGNYLWRLIRFDLGFSAIYGKPVATVIFERLPATLALMTAALSFALQWLPAGGFEDIASGLTGFARLRDIAAHLVLPTLTLGLIFLAIYLRIMRASMLEVLTLDFVRTARAKGLDETRVMLRHVLRNAMLPMVTLIGLQAGTMLGGSVVVESVFSLPGLGRLAYEAVVQRDLNTLLGIVFISALLVIIVNFLVDLLYARLDPRIGTGGAP